MEAIVLIIGELIVAALAPLVALLVELFGAAIAVMLSLVPGRQRAASTATSGKTTRVVAMLLLSLAALMALALIIINQFFFASALQRVFSTVESRSGIATECQRIDGSLFSGRADLGQCTVRRLSHEATTFDLSIDRLSINLRVFSLFGTARVEEAIVAGVSGWAKRHGTPGDSSAAPAHEIKPRRAFEIDTLNVSAIDLTVAGVNPDGNTFEIPIEIEYAQSAPLRSRLALFDLLFRSNAAGTIAGAPFEISTGLLPDGRKTAWRAEQVPVASLGALTGGPLSWFSKGVVDVNVSDQWQRGDTLDIAMRWQLQFSDVEVNAPPDTGMLTRIAAKPITAYINRLDGEFPLTFEMIINENQFEHASSAAAAGLWSAVGDAARQVLASIGVSDDLTTETADGIKDRAKSIIDRLRKPKDDEPKP